MRDKPRKANGGRRRVAPLVFGLALGVGTAAPVRAGFIPTEPHNFGLTAVGEGRDLLVSAVVTERATTERSACEVVVSFKDQAGAVVRSARLRLEGHEAESASIGWADLPGTELFKQVRPEVTSPYDSADARICACAGLVVTSQLLSSDGAVVALSTLAWGPRPGPGPPPICELREE
jgi:hypothetical protein